MSRSKQTKIWLLAILFSVLVGCGEAPTGTGGGADPTAPTSPVGAGGAGVGGSLAPETITVTSTLQTIDATGSTQVNANVQDVYGVAVANGTVVDFTTNLAGTSISTPVSTVGGIASAVFRANNVAGTATVTATADTISGFTTITINASSPASIVLDSATPTEIGVKGSGMEEISLLTFAVSDVYGNPVSDGTTVNFSIGFGLGGGEQISPLSTTTVAGLASVTVIAGKKSGLLGVIATEPNSGVATTGSVPIFGGRGIATNFALETKLASFEGLDRIGNTNDFTVFLADIFGNPIRPGTAVSFITEVGSIPASVTDDVGIVVATFTTPGGDPYTTLKGHPLGSGTGKGGWMTVLAMVPGQEAFSDNNNNGIYDVGDSFSPALHDLSEPFLDSNENGSFDIGEPYNDTNLDGVFSAGNGVHDADTVIWKSIVVVLSTKDFTIFPVGGPLSYTFTVVDGYNNPIDASSTYVASLSFVAPGSAGTITGTVTSPVPFGVSYTQPGGPAVPIYVPTFINATVTGHLPGDVLKVSVDGPSVSKAIDGL